MGVLNIFVIINERFLKGDIFIYYRFVLIFLEYLLDIFFLLLEVSM